MAASFDIMLPEVIRDLELPRFGYQVMAKDPPSFTPFPDGRCLFLWQDQRRSCEEIARFSRPDAETYPLYVARLERLARFVEWLLPLTPPNLAPRSWRDLWELARLARRVLGLPAQSLVDLARILTQSVRDFLDGWFESDPLKVNLALGELPSFRALPGTRVGPQHRATIHLCPSLDAMEQAWDDAKYGRPSARPMLEVTIPTTLESEYGMTGGNIFHGAMSLDQLFCLRPVAGWARYRTPIRNLYLCGSGAHPGGGVTGAPYDSGSYDSGSGFANFISPDDVPTGYLAEQRTRTAIHCG